MVFSSIVNLVLLAVIVICAWQGYKKGILMGFVEILVFVLALFGGQFLSTAFSGTVTPALQPFVSGYAESRVENAVLEELGYTADETGSYNVSVSCDDLLAANPGVGYSVCCRVYEGLGIYAAQAETLAARTVEGIEATELAGAITDTICSTLAGVGGFLLFFLLVFIGLTVVVNLPNLSFRLPYIGLVNDIGGAILGVLTGFLYCALLVWFARYAGLLLPEEKLRTASLAAYFLNRDLLSSIITL